MAMVRDSGQEKGNYSLGFTVYKVVAGPVLRALMFRASCTWGFNPVRAFLQR